MEDTFVGGAIVVVLAVLFIAFWINNPGAWRVFTKAGEPGWAAYVPIYNVVVMSRIAQQSGAAKAGSWTVIVLLCIFLSPIILFHPALVFGYPIGRAFGQSKGFSVLLAVPLVSIITWLILGYGPAEYLGAPGQPATSAEWGRPPISTSTR